MLTVKTITIENFRGIKIPLAIDLYKGGRPTSAILYGRNGTGKSSIVDAWEWLINFEIKDLQKENVSTSDYPHKLSNGDNCSIKIEFGHATIRTASATFNKRKITTPTTAGDYDAFKAHTIYPNYLRYADLQEFVYLSKTDKYKFIARFFGLENFMKNQTDIQASIARLKIQLQQQQTSLQQNTAKIRSFIPIVAIENASVVAFINVIARRHSIAEITDFKESVNVKAALDALVKANPIAAELAAWLAFQSRLNSFYPLPTIEQKLKELEEVFINLKKDEANITKLILTDLYEKSISILQKLEDKTKCPLCDNTFDGDIIEHIREKHTALKELQTLKAGYDAKTVALQKLIVQVNQKITAIQAENNSIVLTEFEEFFKQVVIVVQHLPAISEVLKRPLTEIEALDISTNNAVATIEKLQADEVQYKAAITAKINALKADIISKSLADDLTALAQLIPVYIDYLKNEAKFTYLQKVLTNLEATYTKLTAFIQLQIQNTFTAIQSDLADCYNVLEDSNLFLKNPEIKLVTGKDKAVELEIEFVGTKTTPAFKVMSESQVNSFGLAIFLAAVKYFNANFKFIILDDVVNSFDAFKRPKVATLLASKFNDFQCLLLTHDQIFFDTIQRMFPNWQRYKFTAWDYTTGPKFRLSRSYAEDIQFHIDEDEPIKAGQTLGRYLEWILGTINEKLETPIRYKIENAYTLAEFYDPLVARLNNKLKQTGSTHKLTNEFNQIEQGTIFRNYCAHWKNEPTPFTSQEIDAVFKKWIDIENMLYCTGCSGFVEYSKTGSTEYIKCACGNLDLKSSSFYI